MYRPDDLYIRCDHLPLARSLTKAKLNSLHFRRAPPDLQRAPLNSFSLSYDRILTTSPNPTMRQKATKRQTEFRHVMI